MPQWGLKGPENETRGRQIGSRLQFPSLHLIKDLQNMIYPAKLK